MKCHVWSIVPFYTKLGVYTFCGCMLDRPVLLGDCALDGAVLVFPLGGSAELVGFPAGFEGTEVSPDILYANNRKTIKREK